MHIVADVASPDAVDAIGNFAIERSGRIDTWVNNADIAMYGKPTETRSPISDACSRLILGSLHGCRTAVRHLNSRRRHLNVGSVASDRAAPMMGIYSAAKHAVKGYTDALRVELEHDGLPISVSL